MLWYIMPRSPPGTSWARYVHVVLVHRASAPSQVSMSVWECPLHQVDSKGTGYSSLKYRSGVLEYQIHLYNIEGLKSIELHVGSPGTHGDVAAVFYAAADVKKASNSHFVAQGTLVATDLIGPFLLPLGEHLDVSFVHDRYVPMMCCKRDLPGL
jgi:hypothetical protein